MHLDPLPIIQQWLSRFPYHDCGDMPRYGLLAWLRADFKDKEGGWYDLAADCLIAAGIGQPEEQGSTVYVRASY